MAQPFNMSQATRIAVQRAGKVSKLAYVRTDEALKSWNVGEALNLTAEVCSYSDDCQTIINKMVALNGNVPSKDRTKMTAAISALTKELKVMHGDTFALVGGYFNNPTEFNAKDEPIKFTPIWAAERTA
jgi:hypothetical protein